MSDAPAHERPEADPPVLTSLDDGVLTVTLNRPHRRNATTWDMVRMLHESLTHAAEDDEVRVVVLTGAGASFCVGADAAVVASGDQAQRDTRTLRGRSVEDDEARLRFASEVVEILVDFSKPTVAAVNGACAGAGLSLALATDLQVVDRTAAVSTAFVGAAVSGDLGSAWLLTRAVGGSRARALLLDARKITGDEAAGLGLFTEATAEVRSRVRVLSAKLAGQSASAMRLAKRNLRDAGSSPLADYLRQEVPRMVECSRSDDARLAAQAFLDRRNPVLGGR